jgi:hypothetical protein
LAFLKNALLVLVGIVLFLGLVAYSEGAVTVYVRNKKEGFPILVPFPALVLTEGIRFVPRRDLHVPPGDLKQWLPAIEAASQELGRAPDGLFVDVKEGAEHVIIAKCRESLVVRVDDDDETVHVSVPVETLRSVAEVLARDESPI